jgi:hypothetical protein
MSVVIAEKAGREVLLVSPSRPTSTSTAADPVVNPRATSVAAGAQLAAEQHRTPAQAVGQHAAHQRARVLPRPNAPSTSPTNDGVRSSSSVR